MTERIFQPTCPVRGTTTLHVHIRYHAPISTHVPRTGHDIAATLTIPKVAISTHVPRTGHDVGTMPCI